MATPTTTPSTVKISPLTTREAVLDGLYRCLRSYDTYDVALHDSAFYPSDSTSFRLATHGTYTGLESIRGILHHAGPIDTQHIAANERVNIAADGKTAHLTAEATHQHAKAGEGPDPTSKKYLAGVRYDADLRLDESDGLWKFTRFDMDIVWADGDPSVMG